MWKILHGPGFCFNFASSKQKMQNLKNKMQNWSQFNWKTKCFVKRSSVSRFETRQTKCFFRMLGMGFE